MDEYAQPTVTIYSSTSADAENGLTPKTVLQLGGKSLTITNLKSFSQWSVIPWIISNDDGVALVSFTNLNLTLVKALDLISNKNIVYANLNFNQTSNAWETLPAGISLSILFNNNRTGLLHEWNFGKQCIISCTDKDLYSYFSSTFDIDWYDLTTSATLAATSPILFIKCN